MPEFLILTLGCKLNQLESEAVSDAFSQAGFKQITENKLTDPPAFVIINTCTVTSKADQKARRVIRKALRDYPDSRVFVTGCYAQLNKDDLLKLDPNYKPNSDDFRRTQRLFVINKADILSLPVHLKNIETNNDISHFSLLSPHSSFPDSLFAFNPRHFSAHTRSFLKIQDGCDKHCTYCRIRLARGSSVSLAAEEVLARLRILEQDHAEVVLTGVNISQYGEHRTENKEQFTVCGLAELLDYLLSGTDKIAIRLSSLAPESVDEKLAKVLTHKRIRPHFHLSIQSGSKKILERMGRDYNAQTIEKAADLLRSAKNDPFLACDIITGFPGEAEAEFEQTLSLCRKLDLAWIHVFPYSKRPGTPAFSFQDCVAESETTRRVRLLTDLAEHGRSAYVQRWLGREVEVLTETSKPQEGSRGVSDNYLKLLIRCKNKTPSPGEVLKCEITEIGDFLSYDAIAQMVRV